MGLVTRANQFVETAAPWELAKQPEAARHLDQVLAALAEAVRIIAILLEPFMPSVAEEIWVQLGLSAPRRFEDASRWGVLPAGQVMGSHPVLFPRLDRQAVKKTS